MATSLLSPWAVIIFIGGFIAYRYSSKANRRRNLPPGPKPLPLVGNVRDLPPADVPEFQHWLKHKDLYGPISSVTVFGSTLILIHDEKIAHDILEKTANTTSGRPSMVFAGELCGYKTVTAFQDYGSTFRRYRSLIHREIGTKAASAKFENGQEVEVGRQLVRTLNEPGKWLQHLKT